MTERGKNFALVAVWLIAAVVALSMVCEFAVWLMTR